MKKCFASHRPGIHFLRVTLLLSTLLLTLFLAACDGATSTNSSPQNSKETQPAITGVGIFREYPLPQSDDGLMRPAIDHEGRIWFGEMNRNKLAVFDPRTSAFQQITPLHGQSGIMGVEVAADDTIWYAEQYADYIGHYFPKTGHFKLYPLSPMIVPDPSNAKKTLTLPSAPNDLAIDAHGNIWFTEINAGAVGELIPATGHITQFPLWTNRAQAQQIDPYGIAVDPQGLIWFTEIDSSRIGRIDPRNGTITYYSLPRGTNAPMEIVSDQQGTLWITSFSNNLLLSFDPRTGIFTPYDAPHGSSGGGGIYGVAVGTDNAIWITVSAQDVIARLDRNSKRFVYYAIPTQGGLPLGIIAINHTLWFTEAGSNMIGMLQLAGS